MNPEPRAALPPCVVFEDEHLLVVSKPPGWNTHSPAPHAGEGIYDWLRHREPRWGSLAIIHRLDKETSGLLVFGKTPLANRSLTEQFTRREVKKAYRLLTDRPVAREAFTVTSAILRNGDRYLARPLVAGGEPAETRFRVMSRAAGRTLIEAEPVTGRTHQIRVHAAAEGLPILGDTLYGGTAGPRVCLHAARLAFRHPATGEALEFAVEADFATEPWTVMRGACVAPVETDAFRWRHGAADGCPGTYVERLGEFVLVQSERQPTVAEVARFWEEELVQRPPSPRPSFPGEGASGAADPQSLGAMPQVSDPLPPADAPGTGERPTTPVTAMAGLLVLPLLGGEGRGEGRCSPSVLRGVYHKTLTRHVRQATTAETSPQLLAGEPAPERFIVRENGLRYELSFAEGYSVGLFLDQRDNRRRLLVNHVAAGFPLFPDGAAVREVLNCFAYTCAFSVAAARGGARATSLDLSRKYLDWGRRNFALNDLDPAAHDFIYGDVFDWLRRLGKKGRQFDAVLLDPPTFSRSKEHGDFRAEEDYGDLVGHALRVLKPGGVLFASTNAARLEPEGFLAQVRGAVAAAGRSVAQEHYVPQPPDFPISREEPAYLKTVWLRVG